MKKNILVLDDCRFMLNLIGDLLKSFNYDVTAVDNSKDALKRITSARYDLIITDMNIPEIDGLEFTRQVRSYPGCRFLPIIMISGQKDDEKISMAKKMGVSTFLSKPIQEDKLKSILEIILNKRMTPRVPIRMKVLYKKSGESSFISTYTQNVSLGGMFLEAENPLSPGDRIEIKMNLEENKPPMLCQARVAWAFQASSPKSENPSGMGLTFLKVDEGQLQQFIQTGAWKYNS